MVKELISRPPLPKLSVMTPNVRTIYEHLKDAGVMDTTTFKAFKRDVRRIAAKFFDELICFSKFEDLSQWDEFSKEMAARYPQLKLCYNYWPLQAYYDVWIMNRDIHQRRQSKDCEVRRFKLANLRRARESKVYYIGHLPPGRHKLPRNRSNSDSPMCSKFVDSDEQIPLESPKPLVNEVYPWRYHNGCALPSSPSVPSFSPLMTYPEKCLACGRHPNLTPGQTMDIYHFLASNSMFEILPVLYSFGIAHNGHFQLLCSLSTMERTVLLAELGPNVDVQTLLERLDQYAISTESISTQGSGSGVIGNSLSSPSIISSARMLCDQHAGSGDDFQRAIAERLQVVLGTKQLHFLAPVAVIYGLVDDESLDKTLRKAANRRASSGKLLPDHANVTTFYQQLLQMVLRELAQCAHM
ncbi:hypothetical protein L218DRAFT_652282 [Marasmius fiardii PR-910]|nr:hypothetical protein L218DRAFT_652282 [Marasmius fiardii PR-910]